MMQNHTINSMIHYIIFQVIAYQIIKNKMNNFANLIVVVD